MNSKRIGSIFFSHYMGLILLLASLFAYPSSAEDLAYVPSAAHSKTFGKVFKRLQRGHYRILKINDELSCQVFDRYLAYLDPSRMYFLASDVKEFESFRLTLDDAMVKSKLTPAFKIFARFQERRLDRAKFLMQAMETRFDTLRFDGDDELELDREKAPWPYSMEEWDELWLKRFKNDVLNLRLAGRTMEDIREILERRYRNRLNRVSQIRDDDVFRTYMNVFTQSYDPHTEYFPPRRAENFDISMKLSFEGIGALLTTEGEYIKVDRLIPGGPAEKAGELRAGDRIVGVAQGLDEEVVDVVGWRVDEAVDLIRGPKGTIVRLGIIPADQPDTGSSRIIQITRNEVKLEEQAAQKKIVSIEGENKELKIGIIELPAFYMDFKGAQRRDPDYKSSTRDVTRLLEELKAEKVDGVVMDLRDNGGGSLREASELTALFLRRGPMVQIRDLRGSIQAIENPSDHPVYEGPLAVLVTRLSASASEIFAAAIQDYGRGLVVGGRTFGKGTVQNMAPLGDGQLKTTHAKFYRVSGGSTQKRGVFPDILFPTIYNNEEIGESALEEALPWDQIDPVEYQRSNSIQAILPTLKELHEKRIAEDPEFVSIIERLDYIAEARKNTVVSLNEENRKKEQEAMEARLLAMENKKRVAQGKEPVESFDELEDSDFDPRVDINPFAQEAANILVDLIRSQSKE